MNLFIFSSIAAFIFCTILSIYVLIRKRNKTSVLFAIQSFLIGFWALFPTVLSFDNEARFLLVRIVYIAAIITPAIFAQFCFSLLGIDNNKTQKYIVRFLYAIFFACLAMLFTPLFFKEISRLSRHYTIVPGKYFIVFPLTFIAACNYSFLRLILKYFIISFSFAFIAAILHFLPMFTQKSELFPHDILLVTFASITAYAIIRYRLMDITLAITRTGIFISVYSIVLGIPFFLAFGFRERLISWLGSNWWTVPLTTSTILATGGPFLYLFIQNRAEAKLFQEQLRYQATLRQASLGMGRIKDLKRLVTLIVHIVTRTVRLEHSMIYLNDSQNKRFYIGAVRSRQVRFSPREVIEYDSPIVNNLSVYKNPIVYDEIKQRTQDFGDLHLAHLEADLKKLDAALVVPSFVDENLIAIVVLGKKLSGQMYSNDDLAVFSILASQAALAIENAQFYDDMKHTHEQLFKAEKMATIGTMADGLSHQINNRLHALGFIAGDILDTIKMKKDMPMPPEVKEMLVEIEHGLSRIQENVSRGGEVVQGLLKYSRKGEEGYTEVDFDHLIEASIEMTQFKIKTGSIRILREYDTKLPKIKGNFTQLQEVFFNLIDNAYDAMQQRKDDLHEDGYIPTIRIMAQNNQPDIMDITFEDNGIGIKGEDRGKLFTPFFTTKLSSKKGTGLGLYVIRKLIEDNHEGQVRYESQFLKGTKVFIRLPIMYT